jgi:UDP-GlcNAc:undecaprenyl-phosphate GlcNAc-1-phosphate transferase
MNVSLVFFGEPFLFSFAIASLLCFVIILLTKNISWRDNRISQRHVHKKRISRFGGVAIIIAFISTLFLNENLFFNYVVWSIIIGGILIMILGIIDDIKPLSWQSQLFSQVVIVLLVFILGIRTEFITNPFGGVIWLIHDNMPFLSLLFMLIWMLIIMNAINWCDGIDGLAGGVVIIAACTLLVISLQPHINQPPIAIISIILVGSVFGFLIFNLPTAKIFAGSSGSFFMGFVISLIAIAAGAKIGTTLLVLAVPLMDLIWVIFSRLREGKSLFRADNRHLHHRLLERGWNVKHILIIYYSLTIFCAIIAIFTQSIGKLVSLLLFCLMILIFFIIFSYDGKEKKFT